MDYEPVKTIKTRFQDIRTILYSEIPDYIAPSLIPDQNNWAILSLYSTKSFEFRWAKKRVEPEFITSKPIPP